MRGKRDRGEMVWRRGLEKERRRGGVGHDLVTYNDCNIVFSAHEPPRYYHQSVPMALLTFLHFKQTRD